MENLFVRLFVFYFVIINVISFITMYADKKRAEAHKWRVPEARLFILAAVLGSIGVLAGMKVFRHKTKHMKFVIGIPFILIVQIIIVYFIIRQ
ncbi:MAG: hypothetical protein K0R09_707 [Clostridiales bacterium]|nr:hypothetical protein [Clostridiales bacterium]